MPSPSFRRWLTTVAFPSWLLALYRRPFLSLTALLIAPLIAACSWLSMENERQWRAQEANDLLVAARLAGRIIQEEIARTQEIEQAVSSRPAFVQALTAHRTAELASYLQIIADVTPMIDRAMVVDESGAVVAQAGAHAADDPAHRLTFPIAEIEPVSGVSLRDPTSGEKVIAVSHRINRDDRLIGALRVEYRLQDIARWLQKVRVEPSGFVYVVDHKGYLAAYPYQVLPGKPKDVSQWPAVAAPASPEGVLLRCSQGSPPKPWTAAIVAIEPYGWRVVAQQPDEAMLKPFRRLVWSFAALIALLAIALLLLLLRWSQLHGATLRLLAQQTRLLRASQQSRLKDLSRRPKPKDFPGDA